MHELVVDFITSLDGYGAAEGWPGSRSLRSHCAQATLSSSAPAAYASTAARPPTSNVSIADRHHAWSTKRISRARIEYRPMPMAWRGPL